MKTVIHGEVINHGARSGFVETNDWLLKEVLGNPLEEGLGERGPNPEQFFAAAYSSCFHSSVKNAAKRLGIPLRESAIRAVVRLMEDEGENYHIGAELHGKFEGLSKQEGQRLMEEAMKTNPYSRMLRDPQQVKVVVD